MIVCFCVFSTLLILEKSNRNFHKNLNFCQNFFYKIVRLIFDFFDILFWLFSIIISYNTFIIPFFDFFQVVYPLYLRLKKLTLCFQVSKCISTSLGNVLKNGATLESLTLIPLTTDDEGLRTICEGLKANETLHEFTLKCFLNRPKNLVQRIFNALKFNKTLKKITIEECTIQDEDAKAIYEFLNLNRTVLPLILKIIQIFFQIIIPYFCC